MKTDGKFPRTCNIAAIMFVSANFPSMQLSVIISSETLYYISVIVDGMGSHMEDRWIDKFDSKH